MATKEDLVKEIKEVLYRLLSDDRAFDFKDEHIVDGIALRALREWAIKKGLDMSDTTESTIGKFAEIVLGKLQTQETEVGSQKRK